MRNLRGPLIALALALGGCDSLPDSKASEAQVAVFHQQLDAGNYAAIYQAAGTEMKTQVTEADFTRLLAAVHRKLGNVKSAEMVQSNVMAGTDGTRATLTYQTKFERGTGTETFVYTGTKPAPVLIGYDIASTDMLVN